jgi:hypothetical protein
MDLRCSDHMDLHIEKCMPIRTPANPFPPGTPKHVDFEIWAAGIDQFNTAPFFKKKPGKTPHELDYLRGIHRFSTLKTLQSYLTSALLGVSVRVTSVWLDKASYVYPTKTAYSPPRRELADLAVLIRRGKEHQYMWLLQAKKSGSGTANLPTDTPTLKEVELLECMPNFNFVRADKTCSLICLQKDFGSNPAQFQHWSFLMLKDDPSQYVTTTNPCEWRWPGVQVPLQTGSFAHEILAMCTPHPLPTHGADVAAGTPHLEWRKLWHELFERSRTKKSSKFAGGDLIHTAFVSRIVPFTATLSQSEDGRIRRLTELWSDEVGDLMHLNEAPSVLTTGYSNTGVDVIGGGFSPYDLEPLFPIDDFDQADDAVSESSGGNNDGNLNEPPDDDDGGRPGGGIGQTLVIDIMN